MTTKKPEYKWPAEWEAQDAVWLSWPHREDLWQGGLSELHGVFGDVAAAIAPHAQVRINAAAQYHAGILEICAEKGIERERVALYDHATNDVWCRDHGPIFVRKCATGELVVTDWEFNAWGGKFEPWDMDNMIPQRIAGSLGMERISSKMILEGGAIEGNGAGLLLTTESVLMNPNRNFPRWSKQDMEAEMQRMLGVSEIFWLGKGIEGDDTDGHIDDMVRFTREDQVVSIAEPDAKSPHYRALAENNERLQDLKTCDGSRVEVVPVHMPEPLIVPGWRLEQLPASYANFLIVNDGVIVPIFQQPKNDDRALGILRDLFPGKSVVGVDARRLVIEGGAIHCITQQQPRPGVSA